MNLPRTGKASPAAGAARCDDETSGSTVTYGGVTCVVGGGDGRVRSGSPVA
ncbi:hypothetical protein HMPREF9057_01841 [Actinomyces sp. oral taxon 171 str. F0337]|nr:hypothetical protein HMPREF9057_01841 [Actinomyces sp. oral taxon 171 str. F0337]